MDARSKTSCDMDYHKSQVLEHVERMVSHVGRVLTHRGAFQVCNRTSCLGFLEMSLFLITNRLHKSILPRLQLVYIILYMTSCIYMRSCI